MPKPTYPLAPHLTRITYILPKSDKALVEKAAAKAGVSMSGLINWALCDTGILPATARWVKPVKVIEISFELPERDAQEVERAAKAAGLSLEAFIAQSLAKTRALPTEAA
jgi:predicted HicB family RNase H-like nuclease